MSETTPAAGPSTSDMWHLNWTPDPPGIVVIGIDEVGLGPLAGPVVMAAVAIPVGAVDGVRDSKVVSNGDERRELADAIQAKADWYLILERSVEDINARGLGICVREMMTELIVAAREKFGRKAHIVVDGESRQLSNKLKKKLGSVEFVIGGDSKVYQVAAASLVAKSHNDANLFRLHEEYPAYNFAQHKGYGTPGHKRALLEHGPCPAHRRKPVHKILVKDPKRLREQTEQVLDLPRSAAKSLADKAWALEGYLSDWQRNFIADIRRKLERGAETTPRQNWFIREAHKEARKRAQRAGEKV